MYFNEYSWRDTEAEIQLQEVSKFQCLIPNPNWLVWKGHRHQELAPIPMGG